MEKIKIANRWIGEGEPCFVIAEVGANHDKKLSQAKELIDIAAEAGADAVKFQNFTAENFVSRKMDYFPTLDSSKSVYDAIKEAELPAEWLGELKEYARQRGIIFFSTPSHKVDVDKLCEIDVPAFKWGSVQITDIPTLKYAAEKGKPMIIATGASDLADVQDAINAVYSTGNREVILLHCTALYPTRIDQVNLKALDTLRNAFHVPVGYSDHTLGIAVAIAAVAKGACVIEKHFTLSRKLKGPDHSFAMEPDELKRLVKAIRETEKCLGSPIKRRLEEEEEIAKLGRRSIVAKVDIPEGTVIDGNMFTLKRPGYGISPRFVDVVIGRTAKRNIEKDDIITWEMV